MVFRTPRKGNAEQENKKQNRCKIPKKIKNKNQHSTEGKIATKCSYQSAFAATKKKTLFLPVLPPQKDQSRIFSQQPLPSFVGRTAKNSTAANPKTTYINNPNENRFHLGTWGRRMPSLAISDTPGGASISLPLSSASKAAICRAFSSASFLMVASDFASWRRTPSGSAVR